MKKNKIILKMLIITVILMFTVLTNTSKAGFWSDIFNAGDNFLTTGANAANTPIKTMNGNIVENRVAASDEEVKNIMSDLYSILFPLGVAITVIIGGVLGIKYMMASAEDKAKVKESMVPYVVGCIVIYGALGIWRIAITIFSALG